MGLFNKPVADELPTAELTPLSPEDDFVQKQSVAEEQARELDKQRNRDMLAQFVKDRAEEEQAMTLEERLTLHEIKKLKCEQRLILQNIAKVEQDMEHDRQVHDLCMAREQAELPFDDPEVEKLLQDLSDEEEANAQAEEDAAAKELGLDPKGSSALGSWLLTLCLLAAVGTLLFVGYNKATHHPDGTISEAISTSVEQVKSVLPGAGAPESE